MSVRLVAKPALRCSDPWRLDEQMDAHPMLGDHYPCSSWSFCPRPAGRSWRRVNRVSARVGERSRAQRSSHRLAPRRSAHQECCRLGVCRVKADRPKLWRIDAGSPGDGWVSRCLIPGCLDKRAEPTSCRFMDGLTRGSVPAPVGGLDPRAVGFHDRSSRHLARSLI